MPGVFKIISSSVLGKRGDEYHMEVALGEGVRAFNNWNGKDGYPSWKYYKGPIYQDEGQPYEENPASDPISEEDVPNEVLSTEEALKRLNLG